MLRDHRQKWLEVGTSRRVLYVETCRQALRRLSSRWANTAALAKGLAEDSPLVGEEWMLGPLIVARGLRLLERALLARGRPFPVYIHRRIDGTDIVRVFPDGLLETALWLGMSADVWVRGKTTQGREYQASFEVEPRVSLVLGAGNVSSIAATDMLHKLFVENQVVLLKMNPVNEYLGPILEEVFYPLIRDGFLRIVYGGADIGQAACAHPDIDTIHITGSEHTFAAIHSAVDKPVTAELGCVSPVLVVPGPWSAREVKFQATHLAGIMAMNAGCNCVAPQVIVMARGWSQREAFLGALRKAISELPQREAYYPGATQRREKFLATYPQAVSEYAPWTFIPDVDPDAQPMVLKEEAFCGLLAEVSLKTESPDDFLDQAVDFVNQKVWGNLSATMLIHTQTERAFERVFHRALANLRYGTIGVNLWPGVGFGLMGPPWGAYPDNTVEDIQSGLGHVHNLYFLDHPEKTVLRGPFTTPYVPPWFPNNPKLVKTAQALTHFELEPSLANLFRVHRAILRQTLARKQ